MTTVSFKHDKVLGVKSIFHVSCLFKNYNNPSYISRSNILENMDNGEIGR